MNEMTSTRFIPVMVTSVEVLPSTGLMEVIFGSGLKVAALVSGGALAVLTTRWPTCASFGTSTFTMVAVGVTEGSTPV